MRRSNSRSSQLGRSNSTRSISSQAQANASASAAAAASAALAASQRRSEQAASQPGLLRSNSNASIRSNATGGLGARPGQYNAVRLTGSKRLMQQQQQQQAAASPVATAQATFGRPGGASSVATRSKPPQVQQRRQGGMSSSASIRSFQSDLERINEDYNKTYTYAGQTSAAAMRTAGSTSGSQLGVPLAITRSRRAESIASSVMSDVSDSGVDTAQRAKRSSRVSFSDVDEQTDKRPSRDPSPAGLVKRSAMKAPASAATGSMKGMSPASQLVRKSSNNSLVGVPGILAPPLPKPAPIGNGAGLTTAQEEEEELSTIQSHGSVYSDADEDFKSSPAKPVIAGPVADAPAPTLKLTQQNLAAVEGASRPRGPGSVAGSTGTGTPIKSAMRKTPSLNGSVRFNDEVSHLDADSESEDSFAQRRRAKRINGGGMTMRTSLREDGNGSVRSYTRSETLPVASEPRRMTSLRQTDRSGRRQSMQEPSRAETVQQPALGRRLSMTSLRSLQPGSSRMEEAPRAGLTRRLSVTSLRSQQPAPRYSGLQRRPSQAGSVAGSVRSEAVTQHIAVMELAQRNVQRLLHKDASADVSSLSDNIHQDAREPVRRTSFERKRSTSKLQRRDSISSMQDRTFRTSMRPESLFEGNTGHRRTASDQRAFAPPARPVAVSRSSMSILPSQYTAPPSEPSTPKKSRFRRMSFGFGSSKKTRPADTVGDDVPPVPTLNASDTAVAAPARRYSSDSDTPRLPRLKKETSALTAGTMRSPERMLAAETSAAAGARKTAPPSMKQRPSAQRLDSSVSVSKRTGKVKKFQKLRRLFGIKD